MEENTLAMITGTLMGWLRPSSATATQMLDIWPPGSASRSRESTVGIWGCRAWNTSVGARGAGGTLLRHTRLASPRSASSLSDLTKGLLVTIGHHESLSSVPMCLSNFLRIFWNPMMLVWVKSSNVRLRQREKNTAKIFQGLHQFRKILAPEYLADAWGAPYHFSFSASTNSLSHYLCLL